ncbi:hypothetical protein CWI42_060680 [Ordospora colligata]|uniref:DUF5094 domain-containing protein n=1 Tax=Ordospora colligata OC4 TaxID=1354746 RepID=A0A0B2UJY9_9MICR|nr:uncharacterized protein M896_060680 [Ordospora colligata OC4]KHN69569.1 hypothetical protein M896_060680 [Ordospora colligata OC4]TBU15389.1 hypothetical protein CWI41_060670 [Ordospora colligata]TBU15489.1 hypothetical protein CWI40_060670 [Ordospora colligata]TBU18585.1 hypothetical protein CWI42_060680 [Ordospora colligata]
MKMPRKKITFKTPRKGTKTPTKQVISEELQENTELAEQKSSEGIKNTETQRSHSTALRYKQILEEMKVKEEELIGSYKKENEYLRSLKTDALLYKRFVGFDIVESDGSYEVTHEVVSNNITKSIRFVLLPEDGAYVYKLVESRNIELPDFLSEEITFDECQVKTFFFKVMEAVITKKS